MDTESMNTQDEGRIDPDDVPENRYGNAKTSTPFSGGISEFVRLEEERAELLAQGVDSGELEVPTRPIDTAALTGDEYAYDDGDDLDCSTPLYFDQPEKHKESVKLTPEPEAVETGTINPRTAPNAFALGMTNRPILDVFKENDDKIKKLIGNTNPDIEAMAAGERLMSTGRISCLTPNTKDTNPKDGVGSLKPSYSNVPVPVLYEIGAALLEGERKYGGYNWRVAGVRTSVYINATRRHLDDFWEGKDIDSDSGLSHITKAIASLVVFRDAQIQNMVANDDRPPSSVPFMAEGQERVTDIIARYPNPKPNFTQAEIAHMSNTPVDVYAGQTLGFELEVMLPAPDAPEGFIWAQQGDRRTDLDLTLAVAQALRDDGYGERVLRITRVSDRMELMSDGNEYVSGELRVPVETVFPGDWSLMEATKEEALVATDEPEAVDEAAWGDGGLDESGEVQE